MPALRAFWLEWIGEKIERHQTTKKCAQISTLLFDIQLRILRLPLLEMLPHARRPEALYSSALIQWHTLIRFLLPRWRAIIRI